MAKDKAAKSGKSKASKVDEKVSKGGDDQAFAKPSEAPAAGEGWKFADEDNIGELFIFKPLREQDGVPFEQGAPIPKIIVAEVVHVNRKSPAKSELHEDVHIYQKWVQGALRSSIGTALVLGVLAQDKAKGKGKNAAWVLDDASAKDEAAAREYLAGADPFAGAKAEKKAKGKKK